MLGRMRLFLGVFLSLLYCVSNLFDFCFVVFFGLVIEINIFYIYYLFEYFFWVVEFCYECVFCLSFLFGNILELFFLLIYKFFFQIKDINILFLCFRYYLLICLFFLYFSMFSIVFIIFFLRVNRKNIFMSKI